MADGCCRNTQRKDRHDCCCCCRRRPISLHFVCSVLAQRSAHTQYHCVLMEFVADIFRFLLILPLLHCCCCDNVRTRKSVLYFSSSANSLRAYTHTRTHTAHTEYTDTITLIQLNKYISVVRFLHFQVLLTIEKTIAFAAQQQNTHTDTNTNTDRDTQLALIVFEKRLLISRPFMLLLYNFLLSQIVYSIVSVRLSVFLSLPLVFLSLYLVIIPYPSFVW